MKKINEGFLARLTKEYVGETTRDENRINIDGVDDNHSFTDMNGKFHKKGYKIYTDRTREEIYKSLNTLIKTLIKKRGNECSLNDIDVSNLSELISVFGYGAFDGDISGWDVSNVTDFSFMFSDSSFTGKNCDLNKWKICTDKKKRVNMGSMFRESKFCGDISKWNVSRVTDMSNMFLDCKTFNGDLSKWDVSNVTNFLNMFNKSGFTGENGDIGKWKFYKGKKKLDFRLMFSGTDFKGDLSKWEINYDQNINIIDMFAYSKISDKKKPKFAR